MSTFLLMVDGNPVVVLEEDMLQQGWVRKDEANKRISSLERQVENLSLANEELREESTRMRISLLRGATDDATRLTRG